MHLHRTLLLAHQASVLLDGLVWAIGGSVLLYRLGLESDPNDLDIVTTRRDFEAARLKLESKYGASFRPADSFKLSSHFAKFDRQPLCNIDLMAGIGIQEAVVGEAFVFNRRKIKIIDGLPWMAAHDWLRIYSIFDRPRRVSQLKIYLQQSAKN